MNLKPSLVNSLRRATEGKQLAELRFTQFFATLPAYCYMISPEGNILNVNSAACEALGYSKEELIGKPVSTIYAPESRSRMAGLFDQWKRTGTLRNEEMAIVTKQGETRTVLLSAQPIVNAEGSVLHSVSVQIDITERKRTDELLHQREAELGEAQRLAEIGSWWWDRETDTVIWSHQLYRIAGRDPALAAPRYSEHSSLYTAESWERLQRAVEEALRTGTPYELNLEMVLPDGTTKWLIARGEAICDTTGRVVQLRGTVQDITKRRRAEEALRQSEERFRLSMSSVAEGLYTIDQQGLVTYVNPAAARMFGWTSAELLGRKMHDVTHYKRPDGTPFPASDCAGFQVLQKGISLREHEDVFIRKDGSFFPVVYSSSPLKIEGKTVGVVVGFRDDTQRREAEQAVRESEGRFRLVANTAPVMIWTSGVNKGCTYANQRCVEFTGQPAEALLGNGWTDGIHSNDLEPSWGTYTKAFDRREPCRMEYRLRRHDGEYRWVLASGVPRFNGDGSFAGYIGTAIDITDRKLAEEALSSVSGRLIEAQDEERHRIARELHDDVSQKLALQAIGLEELANILPESQAQLRNRIEDLLKCTSEMSSDVRALSHRLHSSRLELLGLAATMRGFSRELAEQRHVEIDFTDSDVPDFLTPQVSLTLFRILQEGLGNAVKHSGVRHFEVRLEKLADNLQLTIHDSGAGFDPSMAIHNEGIGLISMRERVNLVKGTLSIASKPGGGTQIQVRVPIAAHAGEDQNSGSGTRRT